MSSQNLLAWQNLSGYYGFCDGIYLKGFPTERSKCVLWNPSSRTYWELYCQPSVDVFRGSRSIRAMYHDPLMKDYKVVIADMDRYVVYSCRNNKWGDVKEMKRFFGDYCPNKGVFVNGSIYWVVTDWLEPEVFMRDHEFREVICFDCKDLRFKIMPLPNFINRDENHFQLTSFGGQLCLFISEWETNRLRVMKKVTSADGNDEWVESKEECLCECRSKYHPITPVCQLSENELVFHVLRRLKMVYMLYDKSKNTVVDIHNNHLPSSNIFPVAHVENLLLL